MEPEKIEKLATDFYILKSQSDEERIDQKKLKAVVYGNGEPGIAENMRAVLDELKNINIKLDRKANRLPWRAIGIACGAIIGVATVFELIKRVF